MQNGFQTRLKSSLEARGISAAELSRISGVGKSDISNYINGAYVAKQDKVYLLATALNVDPGWLMTGVEPAQDDSIEALYSRLSPQDRGFVKRMILDLLHREG